MWKPTILCVVSLYEYHKNLFENFRTVEIWNFPIVPNAYWSGFGIFEQSRKDPDEITMIKESSQTLLFMASFVFNKVKWVSFFFWHTSYVLLSSFPVCNRWNVLLKLVNMQRKNTPELMNDGIWCELIVCALHRYGSCVNPLGIARGQSHSNFVLF